MCEWISNFIPHFAGHVITYPHFLSIISGHMSTILANERRRLFCNLFFRWPRQPIYISPEFENTHEAKCHVISYCLMHQENLYVHITAHYAKHLIANDSFLGCHTNSHVVTMCNYSLQKLLLKYSNCSVSLMLA